MEIFEIGKIVLKEKIDGELWTFSVSDVFHLSDEEYAMNEAYNDTLGNYEPDKELPTNSSVRIKAANAIGDSVELVWTPGSRGVFPHTRKKGWTKGVFVKLNIALKRWRFPNA